MTPHNFPLILASGSPRRVELLTEAGITFEAIPANVEEHIDRDQALDPLVISLARLKSQWVAERHPNRFVLGADTLVALEGKPIGKPKDAQDAAEILTGLSGRRHSVITGISLVDPEGRLHEQAVTSFVQFSTLTSESIQSYIATGEPLDKAGAYAIQGIGSKLIHAHQGSYTNIIGLPMDEVTVLLQQAGFLP